MYFVQILPRIETIDAHLPCVISKYLYYHSMSSLTYLTHSILLLVIFYLPFLPVFLMDRLKAIKHTSLGINSLPIQHRVGEILQPLHFMFTDDDNGHNSVGYTLFNKHSIITYFTVTIFNPISYLVIQ